MKQPQMGARSLGPGLFGRIVLKGQYPLFKYEIAGYLGVLGKNVNPLDF